MAELLTFRDTVNSVVPPWLQGFWGGRLMYALAIHFDALIDSTKDGVKLRFPGYYSWESLPILGRERRIPRGPEETPEGFAARLIAWRETKRREGSPVALLRSLRAYLTPHAVTIRHINNAGYRWTITPDGTITVDLITWNWDGMVGLWSRFWIVLEVGSDLFVSDGVWGDPGLWGDGGTVGSSASPEQVAGIRRIVAGHAPHARCENIIVVFNRTDWESQQPDGTWGKPSLRNPKANYWDGC